MRKIIALFSIIFIVAIGYNANAQMSKKEAKDWKKKIKALDPEQFKKMLEENKSLRSQTASLKRELAGVDDKIADRDDQIAAYQDQIKGLKNQLAEAKTQQSTQPSAPQDPPSGINENVGVVFKVQIGAYAKKDLSKYDGKANNFTQESSDGVNKFVIGAFRDYWEADTFKKYLREMGVKDAFIVSYKDGKRVDIKDVLESLSRS